MALYRLTIKDSDWMPEEIIRDLAMSDIYSGVAEIAEIVSDEEGHDRGLIDDHGFPARCWIWWPGPVPSKD